MAYFLRTRRLTLERLAKKPAESLDVVHAVLRATLRDVQDQVRRLEKTQYGWGKSPEDDVRRWAGPIGRLVRQVHMGGLVTAEQVEDLLRRVQDPGHKLRLESGDLRALQTSWQRFRDLVPERLRGPLGNLRRVLDYLEKYCLSFSDLDADHHLQTASDYERERTLWSQQCRQALDHVDTVIDKFFSGPGFFITDLSSNGQETARKANCQHMPFLVLFADACETIREECQVMLSWLDSDASYGPFLQSEMKALEKEHAQLEKKFRTGQDIFHKLRFRLVALQADVDTFSEDKLNLYGAEDELVIREEMLINEANELQLEAELKEYRRDELSRNAATIHPDYLRSKLGKISEELRDLRARLPVLRRKLHNVRYKLGLVKEKLVIGEKREQELVEIKEAFESATKVQARQLGELDVIRQKQVVARRIHLYKTCPDVVHKIYHDQELGANRTRLPGAQGQTDPFERSCHVVTEYIGLDWPRLYRKLPFDPPRGESTVDRDIAELWTKSARLTQEQTSTRAIDRWRRFHSRAKLSDLRDALAVIGRRDILRHITAELTPPRSDDGPGDEAYAWLDPGLVPFMKEVERFDELRAANKI